MALVKVYSLEDIIKATEEEVNGLESSAEQPIFFDGYADLLGYLKDYQRILNNIYDTDGLKKQIEDVLCQCDPDSNIQDDQLDLMIDKLAEYVQNIGRE